MIVLNLPVPPATNGLFANVSEKQRRAALVRGKKLRGRMRTEKYNAWRTEAGWMLKEQRQRPIAGPVDVVIDVEDKGRGDLDNLSKGILDLLVTHGMIEGDGRAVVRRITMEWAAIEGCRVTVRSVAGEHHASNPG